MTKIHFITYGCAANQADTEIMSGLLVQKGYTIGDSISDSDVVIVNTCTVKSPTVSKIFRMLNSLKKENKKIITAGCIPQSEKLPKEHSQIGTYQIENIVEVVEKTLKGNVVERLARKNSSRISFPKIRRNKLIEIVPISHGCFGSCSFCKTKHARGNLYSYPVNDIVRAISKAVTQGAKEIWITSQDNGAYGLDINQNLVNLLKGITSIQRNFKVRVGMANPNHILKFLDELIKLYKNEKFYKFLHVPVQSGSDKVLRDMRREYRVRDYKKIIRKFKKEIPNITISTDIICGYPTETIKDFEKSIALVKETKPDIINISRFWPRPGTLAAKLEQIEGKEIKRRTKLLTQLFHKVALENNKKWIGWKGSILINEKGKNSTFLGRNYAYKQTVVKGKNISLGDEIKVKITKVTPLDLRGLIIR